MCMCCAVPKWNFMVLSSKDGSRVGVSLSLSNFSVGPPIHLYINKLYMRKLYRYSKMTNNPLNTKLYSLKVLFRVVPLSFTCIYTFAIISASAEPTFMQTDNMQ